MNFQGQGLPTAPGLPYNVPREGYNITSNGIECIASELRNAYCAYFYLEFLEISKEPHLTRQYPNHAIIKIDFEKRCGVYDGVGIDIVPDLDGTVSKGDLDFSKHVAGKMIVLPLLYKNAFPTSTRTFQFSPPPRTDLKTLGNVLASITKAGLQHFDLRGEMGMILRGCRDFVYQTFIHLIFSGYIDNRVTMTWPFSGLPSQVVGVSGTMGRHYSDQGDIVHPIRRGRFRIYQRRMPNPSQYEVEP